VEKRPPEGRSLAENTRIKYSRVSSTHTHIRDRIRIPREISVREIIKKFSLPTAFLRADSAIHPFTLDEPERLKSHPGYPKNTPFPPPKYRASTSRESLCSVQNEIRQEMIERAGIRTADLTVYRSDLNRSISRGERYR